MRRGLAVLISWRRTRDRDVPLCTTAFSLVSPLCVLGVDSMGTSLSFE